MIEESAVSAILMNFQPENYEVLQEAMTEKYGKGSSESEIMQNAFGATYRNEKTTWMLPNGMILISKYSNKITEGGLFMMPNKEIQADREKRTKSPGF